VVELALDLITCEKRGLRGGMRLIYKDPNTRWE
jgi:hypothetical protein